MKVAADPQRVLHAHSRVYKKWVSSTKLMLVLNDELRQPMKIVMYFGQAPAI